MNSLILRTVTRALVGLMLLFAVFVLFRGHNEPGGGFISGLIAASAFAIQSIAFGSQAVRRALAIEPQIIAGLGLLLAAASGLPAALLDLPFLTGLWSSVDLGPDTIAVGTPVLFDIGVFLVVVGAIVAIILALEEKS